MFCGGAGAGVGAATGRTISGEKLLETTGGEQGSFSFSSVVFITGGIVVEMEVMAELALEVEMGDSRFVSSLTGLLFKVLVGEEEILTGGTEQVIITFLSTVADTGDEGRGGGGGATSS